MNSALVENLAQQIANLRLGVNREALTGMLSQKLKNITDRLPNERSVVETPNLIVEKINQLTTEVASLKQLLSLKAEPSVDYNDITHLATQKHLRVDNLSMEEAALNLSHSDTERFYNFCSRATFQIENLLNYFYWKRPNGLEALVALLQNKGTVFYEGVPKKVSGVKTYSKILAFETEFYYPLGEQNSKLQIINRVRNLDSHRCSVLVESFDEHFAKHQELSEKITKFYEDAKAKKLSVTYPKTKQDKDTEKQAELAIFLKNRDYSTVREEITTLCKKVTSTTNFA